MKSTNRVNLATAWNVLSAYSFQPGTRTAAVALR
jgi:hypothetical protein